jgi:hypothetical protein
LWGRQGAYLKSEAASFLVRKYYTRVKMSNAQAYNLAVLITDVKNIIAKVFTASFSLA